MEKIELTVGQIVMAARVFNAEKFKEMQLPMKVSLWIVKNGGITAEVVRLFSQNRAKVFETFAEETISDKPEKYIPDNKLGEYEEEVKKMLAEKIEIEYSLIPAKALESVMITPKELFAVIYAIAED